MYMSSLAVCFSLIIAGCIATSPQSISENVAYYLEKGEMGDPPTMHQMYPLSMHMDVRKRSVENADKKYFVRISTSTSSEHCWIKQVKTGPSPIQYWSTSQYLPATKLQETNINHLQVQLDTSPSSCFILPANTKWECIIDTDQLMMDLYKLDSNADLDAVKKVIISESEPIHVPPQDLVADPNSTDIGSNTTVSDLAASNNTVSNITVSNTIVSNATVSNTDPWMEYYQRDHAETSKRSLVIATGSCLQQRFKRLRSFAAMKDYEPDIIILTGDNVYLDMIPYQLGCAMCLNNDEVDGDQCPMWCFNWNWEVVDLNASKEYKRLLRHPDFPHSTDGWNPIWLAIWDDHDYGKDNSDASNPQKLDNKRAFIEFYLALNRHQPWIRTHPEIFEMAEQEHRGIYHHYNHEVMTTEGLLDVRFIMLDVRYHRTRTDMLGIDQWRWLEQIVNRINQEKPNWVVFSLGTTFLLEHPAIVKKIGAESWDIESKKRFELFLSRTGMPRDRIILLSGDVHFSVVHDANGLKELTVSSFTHSLGPLQQCCGTQENEFAISPVTCVNGYGLLELTRDTWKFELKDADKKSYIPFEFNVQSME